MKKNIQIDYTDLAVGLTGTILGLVIYFLVIPATIDLGRAMRLGHHLFQMPDFMARMWTLVIIAMSVAILATSFFGKPQPNGESESTPAACEAVTLKEEALSAGVLLLIMILFIVLLPLLKFFATSILCTLATLLWFGYRNLLKISFLSVAITGLLYLVFTNYLYVRLP